MNLPGKPKAIRETIDEVHLGIRGVPSQKIWCWLYAEHAWVV